jgi:hypothetical protein
METRQFLRLMALISCAGPLTLLGQEDDSLPTRILGWRESDQVAWINSYLAEGLPPGVRAEALGMLVLNKTALTLPVLEKRIEEILRSGSRQGLDSIHPANSERVVGGASALIAYAGDGLALKEASQLMKLDEQRFAGMVNRILFTALNRGNPFAVAYQGFEIGDPAVDKRIVEWTETLIGSKEASDRSSALKWWAEAMVEKCNGVPTVNQWSNDPIASRLKPDENTSLHDEMLGYTVQAATKRTKK